MNFIIAVTAVSLLQMAQFYRTAAVQQVVLSVTSPQKRLPKPDRRFLYKKIAVPIFIEVYYYNREITEFDFRCKKPVPMQLHRNGFTCLFYAHDVCQNNVVNEKNW